MLALSDVELALIGKAFDRAWDNYLRAGLLTPHNLMESRHLLAARILRCHRYGERDEWRLARDAVGYVRELNRQNEPMIIVPAGARPVPKKRTAPMPRRFASRPDVPLQVPDMVGPVSAAEQRA
jgi:hypothetical protein